MGVGIRRARGDELDGVVALIGRAFAAEPLMNWVAGGDAARLRRYAALTVRGIAAAPGGEVLVDAEVTTAALVLPAGGPATGRRERLRRLPQLARGTGPARLPMVLRGLARLERARPPEPHRTLVALGVEPERQGRGRGSAMLCALGDRSAEPLHLATCSQRIVALCERHGYGVAHELALPCGGPLVWTMLPSAGATAWMPAQAMRRPARQPMS
jgi:hypothetical protein